MQQESNSHRIDLTEDKPAFNRRMLKYCYAMDYDDHKASDDKLDHFARSYTNAMVYALAEKYDIEGFKQVAAKKFDNVITTVWDKDRTVLGETFKTTTALVYTSTPDNDRTLRDRLVTYAQKR